MTEIEIALEAMIRLGNALNWNPPVDYRYVNAINGLRRALLPTSPCNGTGSGGCDCLPDEEEES